MDTEYFQRKLTYQFAVWIDTTWEGLGEPVQSHRVEDVFGGGGGVCPFDELLPDPVPMNSAEITIAFMTAGTGVYLPSKKRQWARGEHEADGCGSSPVFFRIRTSCGEELKESFETSPFSIVYIFFINAFWGDPVHGKVD